MLAGIAYVQILINAHLAYYQYTQLLCVYTNYVDRSLATGAL